MRKRERERKRRKEKRKNESKEILKEREREREISSGCNNPDISILFINIENGNSKLGNKSSLLIREKEIQGNISTTMICNNYFGYPDPEPDIRKSKILSK